MAKACDLKKGSLVAINSLPHVLEQLTVSTPSARGAATLYRFRFRNLVNKNKVDMTCKGDDPFTDIFFERRPCQFLYSGQGVYTFMDAEDFSQFELNKDQIEDAVPYLVEDMEGIMALIADGKILTVSVPQKVVLKIEVCDPPMKGATVTSRAKPATCTTGLVVMVPEYIEAGIDIIVQTEDGTFVGRA